MADNKEYIYSPSGEALHEVILTQNCKRKFSLMNEDSVTLAFSLDNPVSFPVGTRFRDFYITKTQKATYNADTGVYDYSLKFDAYYWQWANKVLKYATAAADAPAETSFCITANISMHAEVIEKALARLGYEYEGSPFGVNTTDATISAEAKLIRYENLSVLGGIQAIAEVFGCEWWVEGNIIYFGKLEHGNTPFEFESGVNVSTISFSDLKESVPNRLYVFGSDRNLPPDYRGTVSADTVGGVVNKRLMLPSGTPYLQSREDIPESEIVEKAVVVEEVYPRTRLTVSMKPETYASDTENEDGTVKTQTYYRVRCEEEFKFSQAYILPDEELKIRFTSGLLNGMEFGAHFNPKGISEKIEGEWNPEAQMYEIVANEDYGRLLPDTILKPEKGDSFILIGWDSTKIADLGLVAAAERELLEEGAKLLEEYGKDLSTCTCPMAWDYMKRLLAKGEQPKPGDAVVLKEKDHFGEEGRKSRIIGYEYSLDLPCADMVYTVGENISTSRLKNIEEKIESLSKSGETAYIQNSLDYLSKRRSDRTPYSLSVGGKTVAEGGLQAGQSFAPGLNGFGGVIDAKGNAELESLRLRRFLEVPELRYNRVTLLNNVQWATAGGGIVLKATAETATTGKIELKLEEGEYPTIAVDDICMGIYHAETGNATTDSDDRKGNFTFSGFTTIYFRITAIDGTEIRYALRPGHAAHPTESMHFAAYGNFTDETRQQSRYQTASYIRILQGVNDWEFTDGMIASQYGDLEGLTIQGEEMHGYGLYADNIYHRGIIRNVDVKRAEMRADAFSPSGYAYGSVPVGIPASGLNIEFYPWLNESVIKEGVSQWKTERTTGDEEADAAWNAAHASISADADGKFRVGLDIRDAGIGGRAVFTVSCHLVRLRGDYPIHTDISRSVAFDGSEAKIIDRGKWSVGKDYFHEDFNADDIAETSDVWHLGNRWRCMASHTSTAADAPGFGNPLWEWIGGDPELHLGFAETEELYPVSDIHIPLTLVATYHGEDVTRHIADADIVWSRESETAAGVPRTAMDAAWNALHAPTGSEPYGRSVVLEETDCQTEKGGWSQGVGKLTFSVEATLRDPATQAVRKARATYDA